MEYRANVHVVLFSVERFLSHMGYWLFLFIRNTVEAAKCAQYLCPRHDVLYVVSCCMVSYSIIVCLGAAGNLKN